METIKDLINKLLHYIKTNTGKFLGSLMGFLIAIMIFIIGFFKTIFILICVLLGYIIGGKIDEGENLKDLALKIFSMKK